MDIHNMIPLPEIKTYDEAGNVITEWDLEKGWLEDGSEFDEYGRQVMKYTYHLYSEEELAKVLEEREKAALIERRRQLTLDEVTAFIVKSQLNNIDISDKDSLRMINYYPEFSEIVRQTVKQGFKFTYEGKLYKTAQPNLTIQEHYKPGVGTESLYIRIDEEHTGKDYDPIPYEGNMILENGKYYTQNNVLYLCNRNTEVAVYHALADLVGLYVEIISE